MAMHRVTRRKRKLAERPATTRPARQQAVIEPKKTASNRENGTEAGSTDAEAY
ncbi:DamX protein [Escherichia coli]|uniref:DamX protein n=1 Tax=Escherichia coli TaxID=562 RepID=A0A376NWI3_ECOLX|nr:DamX protein [Escherichia coli]